MTFFFTTFHFATVGTRTGAAGAAVKVQGLPVSTTPMILTLTSREKRQKKVGQPG